MAEKEFLKEIVELVSQNKRPLLILAGFRPLDDPFNADGAHAGWTKIRKV